MMNYGIDYGYPDIVVKTNSLLGEGPVWNSRQQKLFWLDCFSNKINIYNPETEENETLILPEVIGSFSFIESQQMIVAMQSGFYIYDIQTKELTFISDPEDDKPGNRFNDGKCDPAGRFWAGTMSMSQENSAAKSAPPGSLYQIKLLKDGTAIIKKMLGDVIISNGIAFSPDNSTMYFNDTPLRKISAFDYDIVSGEISNRRFVFDLPDGIGDPDGMCIDTEGMLWIALWNGFRVIRLDPLEGKIIGTIPIPEVRNVTSCCFGGKDLNELYITTSSNGIENDTISNPEIAGSLFRLRLPVSGAEVAELRIFD